MQQLENSTPTPAEESTALSTVSSESQFSPASQSVKKGEWIVSQVLAFLSNMFGILKNLFNSYRQAIISILIIVGAFVSLRVVLAVMDALNEVPLLKPTFQLIGIGYSTWFISRYLLKPSTRQELSQKWQGFLGELEK
jgi:predicted RND superfamily exporter protein